VNTGNFPLRLQYSQLSGTIDVGFNRMGLQFKFPPEGKAIFIPTELQLAQWRVRGHTVTAPTDGRRCKISYRAYHKGM
jgi:hypothetical protein